MRENGLEVYTDAVRNAIQSIPEDYLIKSEKELRSILKPSYQQYQLKGYFWDEIARATQKNTKMTVSRVYENMCSRQHFYDDILKNKRLMAWLMTPIVEYENKAKAALDKVSERYEELINMEITSIRRIKDEDGEVKLIEETDPKKAMVLLGVIRNLEERVKGSSIQRQVSVSANTPSTERGEELALDMDAIEGKLKELEKKVNPFGENKRIENVPNERTADDGQPENDLAKESGEVIEAESKRISRVD